MKKVQKAKRDVYQEVTNKIIEALEAAKKDSKKLPWIKPWKNSATGAAVSMPHNAATGRAYSGVNVLLLWCTEFTSNGWLTYKQAKDLGGNVRKGEKGTLITFFKPLNIKENEGTPEEKTKKIPLIKGFTVFNVEQCDFPEDAKIYEGKTIPEFDGSQVSDIAEKVGAKMELGGNTACFIPSADLIRMPHKQQFKSEEHFEATLAHELTHWTGSKKRLARDLAGRFGSESYAFEELVAELGAAFLCAQLGIEKEEISAGHESYIQSWIGKLKEDNRAIFGASSLARQSNEWITEKVTAA